MVTYFRDESAIAHTDFKGKRAGSAMSKVYKMGLAQDTYLHLWLLASENR